MALTSRDSIVFNAPVNGDTADRIRITINRVDLEAPWRWIAAGWADMKRMPAVSLIYGAVFTGLAMAMLYGLTKAGWPALILPLTGGFLLIGPVLAVGLYEGSRRLQAGEPVAAGDVFFAGFKAPAQLALLGLVLMLIYLAWVETAFLLLMLYSAERAFPPIPDLIPQLLFTGRGLTFLIVGTLEGAALAALVFAISAISAPMLLDKPVGIATGIWTSVRAVWINFWPMLVWALLIAAIVAASIALWFLGLIIAFPVIGHATWHAYREITADS